MPAGLAQRRGWRGWLYFAHLWLGIFVAAQLLLWTASGLFMTAWPIETVRGEPLRRDVAALDLRTAGPLLPLDQLVAASARPVDSATLVSLLGAPVYRLQHGKQVWLIDARSGAQRPVTADDALALARAGTTLAGPATVAALDPANPPGDLRRNVPGWRVAFADGTRVYIGADGAILAIRTQLWRAFDFFWGLHILDPGGREDTHHPLLIGSAALALVSVLSGFGLIFVHFSRRR
ncbi:MAG: hypothetical protein ACRCUI_11785 [Polymorphobacter sp.]